MEVTIKEQTKIGDNEDNTTSIEEIEMLNIRDRIAKFKYVDSDSDSKDLDTLLIELFEIFEELKEVKTIVECVIRDKSNINKDIGQAVLPDIEDEISYIEITIEDVCSKHDDFEANPTQLSITVEELREKVAVFVSIIEAIIDENSNSEVNSFGKYEDHSNDVNLPDESSDIEASLQQMDYSEKFTLKRRLWTSFTMIIGIVFGALDVGTDVWLMFQYYLSGQYLYGTLTMMFVLGPALFNTYVLHHICGLNYSRNTWLYQQLTKRKWPLIILSIVPLASIVVAFNNLILLLKNKMDQKNSRVKTYNLIELQIGDSYLEALPQLTLQLSIILYNIENATQDSIFMNILRWGSIAFSVFTVARVQYSYVTHMANNVEFKEIPLLVICPFLFIGSRVLVVSTGFAVSPAGAGTSLLLQWGVVAVTRYRERREKEKQTIIGSIRVSVMTATTFIFYYYWYSPNRVVCWKVSERIFLYTMYTLQCVLLTTLWCVFNSSAHGTVWYYAVPVVPVLLYVLYIPATLLEGYFVNKREAAFQRQRQGMLENPKQVQ